jgi:hypothetical protein
MQNARRLFTVKSSNVRLELENHQKYRTVSPIGFESDDTLTINLEEKCQYEYVCYVSSTKSDQM